MDVVIEPGPRGVVVVRRENGARLPDLDPVGVRAAFEQSGAIWFRGFDANAQDFFDFISQYTSELITLNSYERTRHGDVNEIQSVTGGSQPMNFHTELGALPGRPDFLSFWCEVPSTSGGETLLVDGVALWNALSEPTQQLFLERRIRYHNVIPKAWWTDRLQSEKREDIERAMSGIPNFEYDLKPDGKLILIWRTSAVFRPNFSSVLCFASNVFPYVVPGLTVSFEDGGQIPHEISQELVATADSIAAEIQWSSGEVVLFDNTRWLHGRRQVRGIRERRIHMLQGYLNFAPDHRIRLKTARPARADA